MNVLREDFLKGLAGMPVAGPSAQAEVDILYVKLNLLSMLAYGHIYHRMLWVGRTTKQATFRLWNPICCIV